MSRIYQGGGADRRYQGRAAGKSYQPYRVTGNEKKVAQQGQQILQDLETKDRERRRGEDLLNTRTSLSQQAAQQNLRVDQVAEAGRHKFHMDVERMALERTQLASRQELEKTGLQVSQAVDQANLETTWFQNLSLTEQKHALANVQQMAANDLSNVQLQGRMDLANTQLASRQGLENTLQQASNNFANYELFSVQNLQEAHMHQQHGLSNAQLKIAGELKQAQIKQKGHLTKSQMKQMNKLNNSILQQQQDLAKSQLADKGTFQNTLLQGRQDLAASQMKQSHALTNSNLASNNELRLAQTKEKGKLSSDQLSARASLQDSQLAARGDLAMSQLEQRQGLSNSQRELQQGTAMNQLDQSQELKRLQMALGHGLSREQLQAQQGLADYQLGGRHDLAKHHANQKISQQLAHMEESFELQAEGRGMQAQFAIDKAHLQAQHAAERASLSQTGLMINGLLKFAELGIELGEVIVEHQEKMRKEEIKKKEEELQYDFLISDGFAAGESPELSMVQQYDQEGMEQTVESSIQSSVNNNPVLAEEVRQADADETMIRNYRQLDTSEAIRAFPGSFDSLISNPNFRVQLADGTSRSLSQVRNASELSTFLDTAARQLTASMGVTGKDKHAMLVQFGKTARKSISSAYSRLAPQIRAANQGERYEAGISNAASYVQSGDVQVAWNTARNAAVTSGQFMGKSNAEINDAVLQDLMARTPDSRLPDLKGIQKISGNAGTTFGSDRRYNQIIDKEIMARRDFQTQQHTSVQRSNNVAVDGITNSVQEMLFSAGTADEARSIREMGVQQLVQLGTPEALDAANSLREKGGLNNNVFMDLVEGFDTGSPPTTQQIMSAYSSGAISHTQRENLIERGQLGDQIDTRIESTGLPSVEKMVQSSVTSVLAEMNVDSVERKGLAGPMTASLTPQFEQELRAYVVNNPKATQGDIIKKAGELQQNLVKELRGDGNIYDSGLITKDGDGIKFDYNTDYVAPVTSRVNPHTGQAQKVYTQANVSDIPSTATTSDVLISKDEFLKATEVWQAGGSDYSPRIRALAAKLGTSPALLVKKQAHALGYGEMPKVIPPSGDESLAVDPVVKQGLDVIGRYESDSVGGYNAVNQGGINNGRDVVGYSGDFRRMGQHGGKDLTSLSIDQVMELQAPRPGMSQSQWNAEGRLHAVGRYQFIGPTLQYVVDKTGIDTSRPFNSEVQDYLAGWLLANSVNGIGQWVGPADKATGTERSIVQQARERLQSSYRILNNPNAGEIQRRRAARIVGNPWF